MAIKGAECAEERPETATVGATQSNTNAVSAIPCLRANAA
jgi:hypothetical protein